jgi:hypothetical protein
MDREFSGHHHHDIPFAGHQPHDGSMSAPNLARNGSNPGSSAKRNGLDNISLVSRSEHVLDHHAAKKPPVNTYHAEPTYKVATAKPVVKSMVTTGDRLIDTRLAGDHSISTISELQRQVDAHLDDLSRDQSQRFCLIQDEDALRIREFARTVEPQKPTVAAPISSKQSYEDARSIEVDLASTNGGTRHFDGHANAPKKAAFAISNIVPAPFSKLQKDKLGTNHISKKVNKPKSETVATVLPLAANELRSDEVADVSQDSRYVFWGEHEYEDYVFIPYNWNIPWDVIMPGKLEGATAETAWSVATVTGCTAIILTAWMLLYWITPDKKVVVAQTDIPTKSFETDLTSHILNIPRWEDDSTTKVDVVIYEPKKPVPPPMDNPWESITPLPPVITTNYVLAPKIEIGRERKVIVAPPKDIPGSELTWNARTRYRSPLSWNSNSMVPDGWLSANSTLRPLENKEVIMPLIRKWLATPASNTTHNSLVNVPADSFRNIRNQANLAAVIQIAQPWFTNGGTVESLLKITNLDPASPIIVGITSKPSDLLKVVDASSNLQTVNSQQLKWHLRQVDSQQPTSYFVKQDSSKPQTAVSNKYEVEMTTHVAFVTKIDTLGVMLQLGSVTPTPKGEYVTLEFQVQNRKQEPLTRATLKVELPPEMAHMRGPVLERDLPEIKGGETQSLRLIVLAQETGQAQVKASVVYDDKELASDQQPVVIQVSQAPTSPPVTQPTPPKPTPDLPQTIPSQKPVVNTVPQAPIACGCQCGSTASADSGWEVMGNYYDSPY